MTKEETRCKVRGCTNSVGGNNTKCGNLCYEHWSQKSSSSLKRVIDDPSQPGGGPEPGDPDLEEIWRMANEIKNSKTKHRNSETEEKPMKEYKLHLPDGVNMSDIEGNDEDII